MEATSHRELCVEERSSILARILIRIAQERGCGPRAEALCSDPEGIDFAGLLRLLDAAQIRPSRFFAEVIELWQEARAA